MSGAFFSRYAVTSIPFFFFLSSSLSLKPESKHEASQPERTHLSDSLSSEFTLKVLHNIPCWVVRGNSRHLIIALGSDC